MNSTVAASAAVIVYVTWLAWVVKKLREPWFPHTFRRGDAVWALRSNSGALRGFVRESTVDKIVVEIIADKITGSGWYETYSPRRAQKRLVPRTT